MDAAAFVETVIGRAYEPANLHCWELARACQAMVFGRALPPVLVAPERRRELVEMMGLRHVYAGWREVPGPEHGAVVFMTRNGHDIALAACHAGVFLALDGGGVLHTDDPHGVVFDTFPELAARNWSDLSFYLPA
jgi:hypothetical protein